MSCVACVSEFLCVHRVCVHLPFVRVCARRDGAVIAAACDKIVQSNPIPMPLNGGVRTRKPVLLSEAESHKHMHNKK
jgi:hypothetical protein